jgi:hypothetical protein
MNKMFLTWIGLSFDAGYVESCVVYVLPVRSEMSKKDVSHSGMKAQESDQTVRSRTH